MWCTLALKICGAPTQAPKQPCGCTKTPETRPSAEPEPQNMAKMRSRGPCRGSPELGFLVKLGRDQLDLLTFQPDVGLERFFAENAHLVALCTLATLDFDFRFFSVPAYSPGQFYLGRWTEGCWIPNKQTDLPSIFFRFPVKKIGC